MLDVLSVGNANVDLMINNDRIPENAEFVVLPGGSACNFAVGCSRLGLKVGFLGFTGRDYFGRLIIGALQMEGVQSFVRKVDGQTGFVVVFTKKYFKKYIKYSGANECLESLSLSPYFSKARHIHLATPPLSLLKQLRAGLSVSLDPGSTLAKCSLEDLRPYLSKVAVFFPNEGEARAITGHDYKRAAMDFLDAGVKIVVIKCGRKGVYLKTASDSFFTKSLDFPVLDTTGAGDAFDSAFITAYLQGKSLREACRWGVISSNVCVTKLGAQQSASLSELTDLYKKYY